MQIVVQPKLLLPGHKKQQLPKPVRIADCRPRGFRGPTAARAARLAAANRQHRQLPAGMPLLRYQLGPSQGAARAPGFAGCWRTHDVV